MNFITDPAFIEKQSMQLIRQQLNQAWKVNELPIIERLIHTSGDPALENMVVIHPKAIEAGIEAIKKGTSIITDVEMVKVGISKKAYAYYNTSVDCFLNDQRVSDMAIEWGLTRSMTAFRLNSNRLAGSIVVIGNAPTALFEVLRLAEDPAQKPALIVGMPVGFIGAKESKDKLIEKTDIPSITIKGTRGGSPLAAATINALIKILKSS